MSALVKIEKKAFSEYLSKINDEFGLELVIDFFDGAWVKDLPAADLIQSNKPTSSGGHTSHIAVTSSSMELFPRRTFQDSSWQRIDIDMIPNKIKQGFNFQNLVPAYLATREAFDSIGKHQIYLSKKEFDSNAFYHLREDLHLGDQLWFLKYKEEYKYLVFALDKDEIRRLDLIERFCFIQLDDKDEDKALNLRKSILKIIKDKDDWISNIQIRSELQTIIPLEHKGSLDTYITIFLDNLVRDNILDVNDANHDKQYQYKDRNLDEYTSEQRSSGQRVRGLTTEEINDRRGSKIDVSNSNHIAIKKKYSTNPAIKETALQLAGYECEYGKLINEDHVTFTSRKYENNYMEGHHLVRMCDQEKSYFVIDDKLVSLDQVDNIVSLCPICHAKIHFGKDEDILLMLETLYEDRKIRLYNSDIKITLDELKGLYVYDY